MRLNKNRILDAATWRPPSKVVRVEVDDGHGGTRIDERVVRMPGQTHLMMLNAAGVVVPVVLGNANRVAEGGRTPYYEQTYRKKIAHGFLPWGRCPVALVASQELSSRTIQCKEILSERPCTGGGFNSDNPCPHIQRERDYRKAKHESQERAKADSYKAEAERDREQREQHHEELIRAQQETAKSLQEAVATLAGKQKGKPGGQG